MTIFISFDGPKSVGKSTLIGVAHEQLIQEGILAEVRVEKLMISPRIRNVLDELFARHRLAPSEETDSAIAEQMLQARMEITSQNILHSEVEVVLLDRWYPSDAVFRQYLDADAIIAKNIQAGVLIPDIVFAVVCSPEISWQRAHALERNLDSKVIFDFAAHELSNTNFLRKARNHKWHVLETDSRSPESLAAEVVQSIKMLEK